MGVIRTISKISKHLTGKSGGNYSTRNYWKVGKRVKLECLDYYYNYIMAGNILSGKKTKLAPYVAKIDELA